MFIIKLEEGTLTFKVDLTNKANSLDAVIHIILITNYLSASWDFARPDHDLQYLGQVT